MLNEDVIKALSLSDSVIDSVTLAQQAELERRERTYRGGHPAPDLQGRIVILVDDGLATGSTMRAAIAAVRKSRPARIVVAIPTGAPSTCEALRAEADEVLCLITPEPFRAVGLWYADFSPTTDEEVVSLLARAQDWTRNDTDEHRVE